MIIVGLNAYHGDVAAAVLRDGALVAALEEERFCRIKHVAGFPARAIEHGAGDGRRHAAPTWTSGPSRAAAACTCCARRGSR